MAFHLYWRGSPDDVGGRGGNHSRRGRVSDHWAGPASRSPGAGEAGIMRDEAGYLITGPDLLQDHRALEKWPLDRDPYYLETNVPGVFAAGDVRHQSVKRCASAVGEGAMAVAFVHRYLAQG